MKKLLYITVLFLLFASLLASCKKEEIHEHSFDNWFITQNSTCTKNGEMTRYCICGEKQSETIPATGHTYSNWVIEKEATCTIDGAKYRICDCEKKQTEKIFAVGHNYVDDICTICNQNKLQPGLYDESNTLIVSWESLVNDYGINISYNYLRHEENALYNVVANNDELWSVKKIVISDKINSIGENAFLDCSFLTSIYIPDSVTRIGSQAFDNCSALKEIIIPCGVSYIGSNVFVDCSSLANITVHRNNEHYVSIEGNLYSKDGSRLIQYAACNSYEVFAIPNTVTSIDKFAFSNCRNLTNIIIGSNVSNIDDGAFDNCYKLVNIIVEEKNKNFTSIDGNLYTKDKTTLIQYATGKTNIEFTVPQSVKTIGYGAFQNCTYLSRVILSENINTIGSFAFYQCTGLTSILIYNKVTTIDIAAFASCTSLSTIYYTGSSTDWTSINIKALNSKIDDVTIYYNCNP